MLKNIVQRAFIRYLFTSQTKVIEAPKKYSQTISKARAVMNLYNLSPSSTGRMFIAPNATVVGQVYIGNDISIGHGTVIRGDINSVLIHNNVSIGDNCVLHTAPSLPSGMPAELEIIADVVIQPGCTLYSCWIDRGAFIGSNTVILQGARIEQGAIILPNSVVPPGRVVPANQVWGGNPIKFIRFAKDQQKFVTRTYAQKTFQISQPYKSQFIGFNNAYLYKPSDPQNDKIKSHHILNINELKNEGNYNPGNPTI